MATLNLRTPGLLVLALAVLLAGCGAPARAPTEAPAKAPAPLDSFAQAKRLGRGINLGNALEAPSEGLWGVVLKEEYFPLLKEQGFDTVRVPVKWSVRAGKEAPYTIDEKFFTRVDWTIEQATKNQLNIIINVHHYDEIFADPAGHKERLLAMWRQIAARYKDRPDTLFFEILNEPHDKLTPDLWNSLLAEAVTEIRKIDQRHTLVVGSAEWGGVGSLSKLKLPPDEKNLIATFHFYEPILFTHQGAPWNGPNYTTLNVKWPGPPAEPMTPGDHVEPWVKQWFDQYSTKPAETNPGGEAAVAAALDRAAEWGKQNNVPMFLGEFGAFEKADMESRVNWTRFVRAEAEKRNMPWAYWEFCSTFGIYKAAENKWNEPLLRALIPR